MLNILIRFVFILLISATVNAIDNKPAELTNFIGIKAGIIQPTPLYGNTGLETGKNAFTTGFKIGKNLSNLFVVDVEYMYRGDNSTETSVPGEKDSSTSWSAKSDSIMLNFSINLIEKLSTVTPYIKAGAGISMNKSYVYTLYDQDTMEQSYYPGKKTNNFAWQVGTGVSFDINSKLATEIEYIYIDRGSIETQPYYTDHNNNSYNTKAIKGDLCDHLISVGLKIRF